MVLPQDEVSAYLENETTIHDHRRAEFFPNNQIVNPQGFYANHSPSDIKGRDKITYTVKSGDNLGLIAGWFRVRSADIKYWNNIHKNFLKVGQKLAIYVPEGQGEYFSKFNNKNLAEKQKSLKEKPATVVPAQNLANNAKKPATEKKSEELASAQPVKKDTTTIKKKTESVEKDYVFLS